MFVKRLEWYQVRVLEILSLVFGSFFYFYIYEGMLQIQVFNKYLLNQGVNEFCKYGLYQKECFVCFREMGEGLDNWYVFSFFMGLRGLFVNF